MGFDRRRIGRVGAGARFYGWSSLESTGRPAGQVLDDDADSFAIAVETSLSKVERVGENGPRIKEGRTIIVKARWLLVRVAVGVRKSALSINTDINGRMKPERQFHRILLIRVRHPSSKPTAAGLDFIEDSMAVAPRGSVETVVDDKV